MRARGLYASNARRRSQLAESLLKRGLEARDVSALLDNHKSTASYTAQTDLSIVFSGNNSCALSPEQIEGPYYVSGERIRKDVTDGQDGVPLAVDIQIVDMETCDPIPGAYFEIWHCNATGVYGGVLAEGNGVGQLDKSNLNNTMLRGAQKTDADGAVQFHSIFPGHYTGRTTHIHVAVHLKATPQANGVSDGLLAWLSFGVNTTLAREINAAATIYEDGSVANPNAGMGGPGPGFPSGVPFPSGFSSGFPFPTAGLPTAPPLPTQT